MNTFARMNAPKGIIVNCAAGAYQDNDGIFEDVLEIIGTEDRADAEHSYGEEPFVPGPQGGERSGEKIRDDGENDHPYCEIFCVKGKNFIEHTRPV